MNRESGDHVAKACWIGVPSVESAPVAGNQRNYKNVLRLKSGALHSPVVLSLLKQVR